MKAKYAKSKAYIYNNGEKTKGQNSLLGHLSVTHPGPSWGTQTGARRRKKSNPDAAIDYFGALPAADREQTRKEKEPQN